jgi:hypothetical protein
LATNKAEHSIKQKQNSPNKTKQKRNNINFVISFHFISFLMALFRRAGNLPHTCPAMLLLPRSAFATSTVNVDGVFADFAFCCLCLLFDNFC